MKINKILFIEPPKDYWFVMGEYLPPPTGLLILAAYVERALPDLDVKVYDSQARGGNWNDVEKEIDTYQPSIVITSGITCNAYTCARVAEIAKTIDKNIRTIIGGVHFSSVPEESLEHFPEIDYIVRGEGEVTLVELIKELRNDKKIGNIKGVTFRHNGKIVNTPPRPLIENLDMLPYPAYHLVEDHVDKYHFTMMTGKNTRFVVLEGARGCNHKCSFCTQWRFWGGCWRTKSAKRIVNEIEYLHENFGGQFIWFADDNFEYTKRGRQLWEKLHTKKFTDDIMLFFQARTDDVVNNPGLVEKFREVGNYWVMVGVESHSPKTLREFKKGIKVPDAYKAMKILNKNDIFSHAMFVIGTRDDNTKSIELLREFSLDIGSDFSIYTVLTPFPGTEYYVSAKQNGWIEDQNYANYDMAHAIMPTKTLSRKQVQEELFICYKQRYGSLAGNIAGVFSKKKLKRNLYRHYARERVLRKLRNLI